MGSASGRAYWNTCGVDDDVNADDDDGDDDDDDDDDCAPRDFDDDAILLAINEGKVLFSCSKKYEMNFFSWISRKKILVLQTNNKKTFHLCRQN